jgi:hypothetical protein
MATPAPVTPLSTDLARTLADLAAEGVACALVGGLAVSAWVDPRTTRDIGLAVAVRDDRHAEQLVRSLCARGYRVHALIEQEAVGRISSDGATCWEV